MKKSWKIALWIFVPATTVVAGVILFVLFCNYAIASCAEYCYSSIEPIPQAETALLLGAAKNTPGGAPNLYFSGRIEAAVKLFHAGKIKHILISGDNSRSDYDEPTDMKNALIEHNVPATAMTLDYAGFRTLDSVVRAKNVFGKNKFLIITQPGHAERSVYIARKYDIEATAFYAAEPERFPWLVKRNRKREKLAWIAAWCDVNLLRRKPKFPK